MTEAFGSEPETMEAPTQTASAASAAKTTDNIALSTRVNSESFGEDTETKHAESDATPAQTAPQQNPARSHAPTVAFASSATSFKPKSPVVYFFRDKLLDDNGMERTLFTMHCERLRVIVECYASTAMIRMEGQWTNRTQDTLDCVFALPVSSDTVTNTTLRIGEARIVTTTLLSKKDIEERNSQNSQQLVAKSVPKDASPGMFRMPFSAVGPGETISLICDYMQPLSYSELKKGYVVSLPLYFMPGTLISSWNEVVEVECRIHTFFSPFMIVDCWTHEIETQQDEHNGLIKVLSGACKPYDMYDPRPFPVTQTGRNFELAFSVQSETEDARVCCVNQSDFDNPDRGSMCVFLAPPAALQSARPPGRAIFFLYDRSASMAGKPYREVTRALHRALEQLTPSDQFNICAFDHRQVYFQERMVAADEHWIRNAKNWIYAFEPQAGGTTFEAAITAALRRVDMSNLRQFIVFITDGSVQDEHRILSNIASKSRQRARFVTLGIGEYCNSYFLQTLATLTRGFSDIALEVDDICRCMENLMRQIRRLPVLTDIEIQAKTDEIELYPFPVPDLYMGEPVLVGIRYKSDVCPEHLTIRGTNDRGTRDIISCRVEQRDNIPVHRMFVQKQMDILTGKAWWKQSSELEQTVTDLSLRYNVPCVYTKLVSFEVEESVLREGMNKELKDSDDNEARRRQQQHVQYAGDPQRDSAWKWYYGSPHLGAHESEGLGYLLIGGIYLQVDAFIKTGEVISDMIRSFGNVEATMHNAPILGLAGGDMDMGTGCACCTDDCGCYCPGCEDCGNCGACGDCDACGGACDGCTVCDGCGSCCAAGECLCAACSMVPACVIL